MAISETGEGVDKIWQSAKEHRAFLESSGLLVERRKFKIQAELEELVASIARDNLKASMENSKQVQKIFNQVVENELDPHSAALGLVQDLFG